MKKHERLISLLIREVEAFYENEGYSAGLSEDDGNELLRLVSFYKEKVNVENTCDSPKEWNWIGYDYYNGYKSASDKYFKIIQQKEKEIKILKEKHEKK